MSEDKKVFQYVQFKSMVSPDFWYKLVEVKLDIEKLDEEKRKIFGVNLKFNLF
jgi:Ubiquitin-like modifier-activating enzyme ATG7 N-terminus